MAVNTLNMDKWLSIKNRPLVIAGPCSVESEEQMMDTAIQIANTGLASALRGGVWKPRTKPGSFEGIGVPALKWIKDAGKATQLPVITEVANAYQVEEALKADIDMLWIGARSTVNPFYVQEIADALKGVDIPVFIKNPIHPEVGLWMGAIERIAASGSTKIGAIHRGFYAYQSSPFRNEPKWELTFELRRLAPEIPILCDPSHIAGKRSLIKEVCQSALDLSLDGFMIETHNHPEKALSDAAQQVTPTQLKEIVESLKTRKESIDDERFIAQLEELRSQVDHVDERLMAMLRERIDIVKQISEVKDENQVQIFQMKRWFKILENRKHKAEDLDLDKDIIHELFQLIHKYSIDVQIRAQQELKTE
jgi:chorismate mutase